MDPDPNVLVDPKFEALGSGSGFYDNNNFDRQVLQEKKNYINRYFFYPDLNLIVWLARERKVNFMK